MTRRQFISDLTSLGLTGGALLGASSCSVLDSYFDSDKKNYKEEVVIIGAGSAGLAAAHVFKKKKIPYRIFEASRRVGGRIYTVETNEFKNGIELGASSFDLKHKVIFNLAKEYKLEVEEIEPNVSQKKIFYYKNKWITQQDLALLLKPYLQTWSLAKLKLFSENKATSEVIVHPLAVSFDQWRLRDFFVSLKPKMDNELMQLLLHWIKTDICATEDQLSALQWFLFWEREMSNSSLYKIQGGNEMLVRSMYERVSGVIPDHLVHTQCPLVNISESDGRFECVFETPKGVKRISTVFLVFAMPVSQLKHVRGLTQLPLAQIKKNAIESLSLGKQVKVILGTKDSWGIDSLGDSFPIHSQAISKNKLIHFSHLFRQAEALYSFPEGVKDIRSFQEETLSELSSIYKKFRNNWSGKFQMIDWSQREWIKGSKFNYMGNQFYKYKGVFTEADFDGRLMFIGDYTHPTEWSHWAGALESGIMAAERISSIYKKVITK